MTSRWILAIRWSAIALVVGNAVLALAVGRNLAALGSWTLLDSLLQQGYWAGDPYRAVGTHLAQTPVVVAMTAGVDDVGILRLAHGVGYLLIPALAWAAALVLVRRTRVFEFLLLGYCVTALTSDYIAVADVNQLFAFTALCSALILRFFTEGGRALPWLAFAVSWVVAFTHGFAVLLAPLLIAQIVLLRRSSPRPPTPRLPWSLTITVLALGTVVSAMSVVWPYSPANVVAASDLGTPLKNTQLVFMVVWLLVLPLAVLPRQGLLRVAGTVLLATGLAWFVLDAAVWATPAERHASRTASALLLFAVLALALVAVLQGWRAGEPGPPRPAWVILPFALMVALLVPIVVQARDFGRYLDDFQAAISERSGTIANEEFVAAVPAAETFEWPYSFPTMSLILGLGREHAIVENPVDNAYISPFDVEDPPVLPSRFTGSAVGG